MEKDYDGFQLVGGQRNKSRNRKKRKSVFAAGHCTDPEDIPSRLPCLSASVQNCWLELNQGNFKKDFEATAVQAGILVQNIIDGGLDDGASKENLAIKKVVCYGIGNYSTCPIARYQFAFLSTICDLFKIEKKDCFLYDPQFSSLEIAGVLHFGYQLITFNEEGKHRSEERTLFYMPHCGKALYNNLLWANWDPVRLQNTAILGNSFTAMSDSMPSRTFRTSLQCISKAMPLMTERSIRNSFTHKDIFNNTSLHVFCTDRETTAGQSKGFWSTTDEPTYDDIEIITANTKSTTN